MVQAEQLAGELSQLREQLAAAHGRLAEVDQLKEQLTAANCQLAELRGCLEKTNEFVQEKEASLATSLAQAEEQRQEVARLGQALELANTAVAQLQDQLTQSLQAPAPSQDHPAAAFFPDEAPASSAAALFASEQQSSTASLFGSEPESSTASLFGGDSHGSTTAAFSSDPSPASAASLFGDQQQQSAAALFSQEPATAAATPQEAGQQEVAWYQGELASYQQALQEWQVWGEQQGVEVQQLRQVLEQREVEVQEARGEVERLGREVQVSGVQDLLAMKQLEVGELRETVERLESEKEELGEQITEMRGSIDELRSINESVEEQFSSQDASQLEEVRGSLEEADRERSRLTKELLEVRAGNETQINNIKNVLQQKESDLEAVNGKVGELLEQIKALEESLADEKKAQEEIGDEYESMQLQVQQSDARIAELVKQIETFKKQSEEKMEELEKLKQESAVKEAASEVEAEPVAELAAEADPVHMELEQYRQAVADWGAWGETKTAEYSQLLESYNQYVEAFGALQGDHALLQQQKEEKEVAWAEMAEQLREKDEEVAVMKPALEALEAEAKEDCDRQEALEVAREELEKKSALLQAALDEKVVQDLNIVEFQDKLNKMDEKFHLVKAALDDKEAEVAQLQTTLDSKLQELVSKNQELESKEQELTETKSKLGEKDELKSALASMAADIASKDQELTEIRSQLAAREEEPAAAAAAAPAADSSAEALAAELEQYRAALGEWAVWAEARTQEQAALQQERDQVVGQMEVIRGQVVEKEQEVAQKEVELVEKTQTIAQLSIKAALQEKVAASKEPVQDSFEAALGLQREELAREQQRQELEARVEEQQEQLAQAAARAQHMAETLGRAQQALSQVVQEKEVLETRLKEVEQEKEAVDSSWGEAEGWGVEQAEVQQGGEEASTELLQLETEISSLKEKLRGVEGAREKQEEEITQAKLKNGKMLVKVKSLTKEVETLKKAKSQSPASSGFDDLDRALEDELKEQVARGQKEVQEARKELEAARQEKEHTAKRLDTLEAGNARLVEMKEKQDYEVEFLGGKIRDLTGQVSGLQWSLAEVEERRETEVSSLTSELAVLSLPAEGREDTSSLRLQVASLTSQLEEGARQEDRLRGELSSLTRAQEEVLQEVAAVRSQTIDLQDTIDRLTGERDELVLVSREVEGGGGFEEITKLNESLNLEIQSLRSSIVEQQGKLPQPAPAEGGELERLRSQLARERSLVLQLESDLQHREVALRQLQAGARERQDSAASLGRESLDREVQGVFLDPSLLQENLQLKADLDSSMRERRLLQGRIHSWQQELGKEQVRRASIILKITSPSSRLLRSQSSSLVSSGGP